ncbi:MAG: class B sortase [Faecalibacterium sp.]
MKRHKRMITALMVLVLAGSLAGLGWQNRDYWQGARDYAEAGQLAGLEEMPAALPGQKEAAPKAQQADPYAAALARTDLGALREVNDEIIGWIWIPGTRISYPLLQTQDNDYYLHHTWKKEPNTVGAIFLDCRSRADLSDFNTIVYGHRMRDGSMFGGLKYYRELSYWQQTPDIYVRNRSGVSRYRIFAAYEAAADALLYTPGLSDQEGKEEVLRHALDNTWIDTGLVPSTQDRVLTLVTCTGQGYASRWVVQAVLQTE